MISAPRDKARGHSRKDRTMVENVEVAYCMAKLEDNIRWVKRSADVYLEVCDGKEDQTYKRTIVHWSSMITAFELAFGVAYFTEC